MAPRYVAEYFHKYASQLGIPKDCDILDVAAGTGSAGQAVNEVMVEFKWSGMKVNARFKKKYQYKILKYTFF
jgi:hypothetical protein